MELKSIKIVPIEKPETMNFILGQSHFIKTVEDLHETLIGSVPGLKFGLAFCEASGPCLVRWSGTDEECLALAKKNAQAVGAGHSFIIFLGNAFPINVLNAVKNVPEVCRIFCATANPVQVIVAELEQGRGILGVIDGGSPLGLEGEKEIQERKELLRRFGYKL
jgi:adenosine/AMP kinase